MITVEARDLRLGLTLAGRYVDALRGATLQLEAGRFHVLTGQPGAGKSTLLSVLATLQPVDAGSLEIIGIPVEELVSERAASLRSKYIGYAGQAVGLVPHMTAAQNIALPYRDGFSLGTEVAEDLLQMFGVPDVAVMLPDELTAGQRYQVAVARALVNEPAILLIDEPFGDIDEDSARIVFDLLRKIAANGRTVLLVSNDRAVTASADDVLIMAGGRIL